MRYHIRGMSCLLLVDDEEEGASQPEGGVELPRGDLVVQLQAGHLPGGIFYVPGDDIPVPSVPVKIHFPVHNVVLAPHLWASSFLMRLESVIHVNRLPPLTLTAPTTRFSTSCTRRTIKQLQCKGESEDRDATPSASAPSCCSCSSWWTSQSCLFQLTPNNWTDFFNDKWISLPMNICICENSVSLYFFSG